ncbi:MAG TPA: hypothetical protein VFZ77_02895 [Acidimicrobiales bacterium]
MGNRGALLTLVDGAPGRLRSLQGALTTWMHRTRTAAVHARLGAPADAGGEPGVAPVAALPGAIGWPGGDADGGPWSGDDDAAPGTGPEGRPAARPGTPVDEGPEVLRSWYVVVALPNRWRVVGRGYVAVSDGQRSWAGTSTLVTERDSTRSAIHDAGVIGACLYPGALLGGLELAGAERDQLEGRSCWRVEARPRPVVSGTSLASTAAPLALRLHHDLVGVDHRMWFDADTGILLRHEGLVDGEVCSWTQLGDLVVDAPVGDREFRPPPGAVVRSRHELLRDHLSAMGVDPDTVDLDDPAKVREALRQGG